MTPTVLASCQDANELLRATCLRLLLARSEGGECSPRGVKVSEINGFGMMVREPARRLVSSPRRRVNVGFAAAETLWNLAGRNDVAMVAHYNSQMTAFSDDGETLRSAYGARLRGLERNTVGWPKLYGMGDQLTQVVRKLYGDPDTRQAVAVFRAPGELAVNTKDQICGLSAQFFLRDGALRQVTHFRSNDVWLGVTYDFFFFSCLQHLVAQALGVPVGPHFWLAGSMHLYERHYADAMAYIEEQTRLESAEDPRHRALDWPAYTPVAWPQDGFPKSNLAWLMSAVTEAIRLETAARAFDVGGSFKSVEDYAAMLPEPSDDPASVLPMSLAAACVLHMALRHERKVMLELESGISPHWDLLGPHLHGIADECFNVPELPPLVRRIAVDFFRPKDKEE